MIEDTIQIPELVILLKLISKVESQNDGRHHTKDAESHVGEASDSASAEEE